MDKGSAPLSETCQVFTHFSNLSLGILLLLQKSKVLSAEDVTKRYEISVRTVYRDMAALSEMGISLYMEER